MSDNGLTAQHMGATEETPNNRALEGKDTYIVGDGSLEVSIRYQGPLTETLRHKLESLGLSIDGQVRHNPGRLGVPVERVVHSPMGEVPPDTNGLQIVAASKVEPVTS